MIEQILYFSAIMMALSMIFIITENIALKMSKRKCHHFEFEKDADPKCHYCDEKFSKLYPEIKSK